MSVQYYPNGIGGSAPGDSLDLARPLQTTGNIWYVSSLIGTDAASPAGQNREKPLATLAQANTNAVDGDIVALLEGHSETYTFATVISKKLTVVGEGITSGRPAVTLSINAAASNALTIVAGVELRNIYFPPSVVANTGAKVEVVGADCKIIGCYFECGATDLGAAVKLTNPDRIRFVNDTFISVATSRAAQPLAAIKTNAAGVAFADLEMFGVIVSAGTVGYSNYAAVDLSTLTVTRINIEALSLLLGADVQLGAAATGRVNVQLATGGSRVAWG